MRRSLSTPRYAVALLLLIGVVIRLAHLAVIDINLPFRLGGLFIEFAQQLSANNYLIPDWIPFYTEGGIPFAYPPLAFYIQAIILDGTSIPVFVLANILPSIILILSLPSFYLLTGQCGLSTKTRLASLLAYATMPMTFVEQIEGGGLPEALGSLVFIWFAYFLIRAYRSGNMGAYGIAGVFLALTVVASPATAYASVFLSAIFGVVHLYRDNWRPPGHTIALVFMVGLVGVVLSSPYWLPVLGNHGIAIFLDSMSEQHTGILGSVKRIVAIFVAFDISGGDFAFFWNLAILGGLVSALLRKQFALVAWFVLILIIPGEGSWLVSIPAALMAGIGLSSIWKLMPKITEGWFADTRWRTPAIAALSALFVGYAFFNGLLSIMDLALDDPYLGVTPDSVSGMQWARDNTPEASKFIVISGSGVVEWSPHLMRREVLNIPFGAEWQPNEEKNMQDLNDKLRDCLDLPCVYISTREHFAYPAFHILINNDLLADLEAATNPDIGSSSAEFNVLMTNDDISVLHVFES